MAKAIIDSGICGFKTDVIVQSEGRHCILRISSDCGEIKALADKLRKVNPYQEISFRGEGPLTFKTFRECCPHPACPVPIGIIKAIEIEAGLALPKDVTIDVSNDNE